LRVLSTLGRQRSSLLPNVPTAVELGVDNFVVEGWNGLLAPGGTPKHIVNRLAAEWAKIAVMPEAKEQMLKAGFEPVSQTPDQFTEYIKRETAQWEKVIKGANFYRTLD
jgi:tripartite-type tricarboxylate transporter receptor subunit TctC